MDCLIAAAESARVAGDAFGALSRRACARIRRRARSRCAGV